MEKETYTFYDVAKKLYEIDPTKINNDLQHFLEFKDGKKKQYRRLHEKIGIPKYAHSKEGGVKSFTKDKYIEKLFSLYAFSEPFFKKLRSFNEPTLKDIHSIIDLYDDFLTRHLRDILTPEEISWHHKIFTQRSTLLERTIYEDLRSKFSDYPGVIVDLMNWFNPRPNKEDIDNMEKLNKKTASAKTFEELSSILEESRTPYDKLLQLPDSRMCREEDFLFLLGKYYEDAIEIYIELSVTKLDLKKLLLNLNKMYSGIVWEFLEIRNTEIDNIIIDVTLENKDNENDDEVYNIINERIERELMSNEDTFQEAKQVYLEKVNPNKKPITMTEEQKRVVEEVIKNARNKLNKKH